MEKPFKPSGYNAASPYFILKDAHKFIKLLSDLFQAKELRSFKNADGSIMHAEVMVYDSVIMLGEASEKFPAIKIVMHVYVPNVDELYERALALGCTSIEAPKQQEGDPDRRGTFLDFAGNMWSLGTQL